MREGRKSHAGNVRAGGVSADLLKLTALVTMLIDHIGAGILERCLIDGYVADAGLYQAVNLLDSVLRCIGRISFPVFCFLLVEGFLHTRSRRGYALRLLAFALLSEIPFDLLFSGGLNPDSQNVFWTLLIGLLVLWGMERSLPRALHSAAHTVFILLILGAGMAAGALLKTDYSWRGVLLIAVIRLLYRDRLLLVVEAPCLFLFTEFLALFSRGLSLSYCLETVLSHFTVFLSFVLIRFYNGKRRRKGHRYFFYLFYPAHLLLIFLIRQLLYML